MADMDALFEYAGQTLAGGYVIYLGLLALLGYAGFHTGVLATLLYLRWRHRLPSRLLPVELVYGFINPLIYLLVFQPYGAFRPRKPIDDWMDAIAWTLFVALWGSRLLLPRTLEASPAARMRLARLCLLGLVVLAGFALSDLTRVWGHQVWGAGPRFRPWWGSVWLLFALAPLYAIPAVLLHTYRTRLMRADARVQFLLLPRRPAVRLAIGASVLALISLGLSMVRSPDAHARARVGELAPVILETASRYQVDPHLLAALVYVTGREQSEPFRDHFERLVTTTFLVDAESHFKLSKPFDCSLGLAQIKPVTALTALRLCEAAGQPWQLWPKHLRDVPELGPEWRPGPDALAACAPPVRPVPTNKPEVVASLLRDESNIAFAGLILGLYQWQWRSAKPEWDISRRPDILATLYQIGFAKSRPHAAPRSNAFGARVAAISRERWLRDRFDGPRLARVAPSSPRTRDPRDPRPVNP